MIQLLLDLQEEMNMPSTLSSGLFTLKEFYNRGVIKLAPDALVYIGGSLTTSVIAPVSGKDDTICIVCDKTFQQHFSCHPTIQNSPSIWPIFKQ